jgi:NAD-binding of NADP-dependent 3-hydroxyisobutyrate dehydrogenase
MLELKGRPMFEEHFEPVLFKLDHMLKDLRHTLEEARALGIELRLPTLAEGFFERALETGHGEEDFGGLSDAGLHAGRARRRRRARCRSVCLLCASMIAFTRPGKRRSSSSQRGVLCISTP